jgi:DNA-binding MarR family transcriptional regulator
MRDPIQTIVDRFVSDLTAALEERSAETIRRALLALDGVTGRRARKAPAKTRRGKSLEPAAVLSALRKTPGSKADELATAMGTTTAAVKRPLQALLAEKKIVKKGARRGTRYTAR